MVAYRFGRAAMRFPWTSADRPLVRANVPAPVPLAQFSLERDGLGRLSDADLHRWTSAWKTRSRLRALGEAELRRREAEANGELAPHWANRLALAVGSAGLLGAAALLLA